MEEKNRVKELRLKAKELYSILIKNKMNVKEAETTLFLMGNEIDRVFNQKRLTITIKDLDIKVKEKKAMQLLDIVKDLSVTEAAGLLYGLENQIKLTLEAESKKKKLKSLKVELL